MLQVIDNSELERRRIPQFGNDASDICPLCDNRSNHIVSVTGDIEETDCFRCGSFGVTGSALARINSLNADERLKISSWNRDQLLEGRFAIIDTNDMEEIGNRPTPRLLERVNRFLLWSDIWLKFQPNRGDWVNINHPLFLSSTHSKDATDFSRILRILEEENLAVLDDSVRREAMFPTARGAAFRITAKGLLHIESIKSAQSVASSGFGAMWFSEEMMPIWINGIAPGIADTGYQPVRIDQVEHVGRIDDEILLQIRKSRFVVADFTGHRGGVYFEAGYALGLNIPVFWTCRFDQISDLHFDIRQYNCIDWKDSEDLRRRLSSRIEFVLGTGPYGVS